MTETEVQSEKNRYGPGTAKYGNFINYYQFNTVSDRVTLLPRNIMELSSLQEETVLCLDIGCNSGDLTQELHKYVMRAPVIARGESSTARPKRCVIIATDLDSMLIERAKESNSNEDITFLCLDIMKEESAAILRSYLVAYNKTSFDFVFLFSVTMWIHVHYGDEGLMRFLRTMSELGTVILLEPQPWKCYLKAKRRLMKVTNEITANFSALTMRVLVERDISNYLMESCNCIKVYATTETKWGRVISVYRVNKNS